MMQATTTLVAGSTEFSSGPAMCVGCRRVTTTVTYARRMKCAQCSRGIEDDGLGRSCWQVLLFDERIACRARSAGGHVS